MNTNQGHYAEFKSVKTKIHSKVIFEKLPFILLFFKKKAIIQVGPAEFGPVEFGGAKFGQVEFGHFDRFLR